MTLYLLGTGAAVSDPHRTTTMLAVSDGTSTLAVDCGGDLVQRMMACGLDPATLDGLILTHEHPDHVSGFPLFMEKLWLTGRSRPIPVYGVRAALGQARRLWEAFDTSRWDGVPEIVWQEVAHEPGTEVLTSDTWHVTAAPVTHPVPTIGLRIEHGPTSRTVAYSCDTAPCERVVELGRDAGVLVHEATGATPGVHSSAEQAAEIAAKAGAHRLLLVHLPPGLTDDDLGDARRWLSEVELGEELGVYNL
ncbi:MAG: MBL fold metallo-hydrolase [Bacteroidota bacterium]